MANHFLISYRHEINLNVHGTLVLFHFALNSFNNSFFISLHVSIVWHECLFLVIFRCDYKWIGRVRLATFHSNVIHVDFIAFDITKSVSYAICFVLLLWTCDSKLRTIYTHFNSIKLANIHFCCFEEPRPSLSLTSFALPHRKPTHETSEKMRQFDSISTKISIVSQSQNDSHQLIIWFTAHLICKRFSLRKIIHSRKKS